MWVGLRLVKGEHAKREYSGVRSQNSEPASEQGQISLKMWSVQVWLHSLSMFSTPLTHNSCAHILLFVIGQSLAPF